MNKNTYSCGRHSWMAPNDSVHTTCDKKGWKQLAGL